MTAQNPPVFLQAGSHPAEDVRRFIGAAVRKPGIVDPDDLAVTGKSGTPNMSVDVAGGRAFVAGTEGTYQGTYLLENRGTTNLVISAADGSNARYDLVVAKVEDSAYSGATDAWSLAVVTGTPSGSPAEPATPANAIVLARVTVGAGVTSITNANITDRRVSTATGGRAAALGGVVVTTSSTRPSSPAVGTVIFETDTGRVYTWSGSAWVIPYPLGRVGGDTATSNSSSFTTIVYPLSATATLLANRRIRVTAIGNPQSSTAAALATLCVCNNAGTILNQGNRVLSSANTSEEIAVVHELTSGAGGSTTFQLGVYANVSSFLAAGATRLTQLIIDDVGPA